MIRWARRHERTDAPEAILRRIERDREGYLEEIRALHSP
jgi:hypothetical protein